MTLDTDVYVLGEIGPVDLFEFVLSQLLEFDGGRYEFPRNRSAVVVESHGDTDWKTKEPKGTWTMETRIGQGLPAWFRMHYRPGGWFQAEDVVCNETNCYYLEDEEQCPGDHQTPPHYLSFDMDTAYGYDGPNGLTCTPLHAIIVGRVYHWLKSQNVEMMWRNEYTGELHKGLDGLEDFLGGGAKAMNWFNEIAMPAITQEIKNASRELT